MDRTKKIKSILEKHFFDLTIYIEDNSYLHKGHNNFDGKEQTHITVFLRNHKKININRLAIHKKINSLLKKEFEQGLHALEIKIT